ncbi:MAG: sigma-70 family RNA polymerase sigma factor [Verrucomicrobiaceae bacterium]|nr:sigma-70 family RNA polymerase sigma factor [Verrucomicrobiaceae bacterium]
MSNPLLTSHAAFPSTRWTLVRRMQKGNESDATQALNELCRQYWYPIYAFTRRHGFARHDAEDITQVFFHRILASEAIKDAREEKGQLRSFMLALLKRVIANHVRHASAQKRGGSPAATLSFDDDSAEDRYLAEPADVCDPAMLFDRAWAEEVLLEARRKLREDFARGNNLEDFERLREYLPHGDNATPYSELAASMGISETALRLQIHRMRKRYAGIIEDQIAQTVSTPAEAKAELEHLMKVIGR